MQSISVTQLAQWQQQPQAFLLLDVRREQALAVSGVQIEGALWKNPALWLDWKDTISKLRPVVVYCAHGHEISQGLTATLLAMGIEAMSLEGGLSAWQDRELPVVTVAPKGDSHAMDYP